MLPDLPSYQDYQSVQTLSDFLWSRCNNFPPPSREATQIWRQKQQGKLLEYPGPHLVSEYTFNQQVMYGFLSLITKGTSIWMGETSFSQPVGRPDSIVKYQPNEEFTARGCLSFPNPSPWSKLDGSHEEGSIRRFAAVCPILG